MNNIDKVELLEILNELGDKIVEIEDTMNAIKHQLNCEDNCDVYDTVCIEEEMDILPIFNSSNEISGVLILKDCECGCGKKYVFKSLLDGSVEACEFANAIINDIKNTN